MQVLTNNECRQIAIINDCFYNVYYILAKLTLKEVGFDREVSEVQARGWSLNN